MSVTKRQYHEYISGNFDCELAEMLYELKDVSSVDDPLDYMDYLCTLKGAGFSKEDTLSILNHLLYEEQVEN